MSDKDKARELKPVTPRTKHLNGELLDWFNYAEALSQENKELKKNLEAMQNTYNLASKQIQKIETENQLLQSQLNEVRGLAEKRTQYNEGVYYEGREILEPDSPYLEGMKDFADEVLKILNKLKDQE